MVRRTISVRQRAKRTRVHGARPRTLRATKLFPLANRSGTTCNVCPASETSSSVAQTKGDERTRRQVIQRNTSGNGVATHLEGRERLSVSRPITLPEPPDRVNSHLWKNRGVGQKRTRGRDGCAPAGTGISPPPVRLALGRGHLAEIGITGEQAVNFLHESVTNGP